MGSAGTAGSQGPIGAAGSVGGTGGQGLEGVQGVTGAAGSPGTTGSQGPTGAPGSAGGQGATGANGAPGLAGSTGPAGATGPTASSGLSQYAHIYNLSPETVALEAAVTFDTNGVLTSGVTHEPGAVITLVNSGTYQVTFSVSATEPNQMALFVNGVLVPGAVYGSGAGTQQNTGQAIINVGAGAVLTVRNHSSAAAVSLASVIGGTQASSNASVVIEKLN
jgi:hypothetical protein